VSIILIAVGVFFNMLHVYELLRESFVVEGWGYSRGL
jgi:hypothetical protein